MIIVKNSLAIHKMQEAGKRLAVIFEEIKKYVQEGISTLELSVVIENELIKKNMVTKTKGYKGYKHASCISLNDEVVHGVPNAHKVIRSGDLVKVDVCAAWQGYCADMARPFIIGDSSASMRTFVEVAQNALDKGIEKAVVGNKVSDISAAIQGEVERNKFGVLRDFAGHGIGKQMHEEPEILNYGEPGRGPLLRPGMTFAVEPMITMGHYAVYIDSDGWTVKTEDKSIATHVEDTILVTDQGPRILTRINPIS